MSDTENQNPPDDDQIVQAPLENSTHTDEEPNIIEKNDSQPDQPEYSPSQQHSDVIVVETEEEKRENTTDRAESPDQPEPKENPLEAQINQLVDPIFETLQKELVAKLLQMKERHIFIPQKKPSLPKDDLKVQEIEQIETEQPHIPSDPSQENFLKLAKEHLDLFKDRVSKGISNQTLLNQEETPIISPNRMQMLEGSTPKNFGRGGSLNIQQENKAFSSNKEIFTESPNLLLFLDYEKSQGIRISDIDNLKIEELKQVFIKKDPHQNITFDVSRPKVIKGLYALPDLMKMLANANLTLNLNETITDADLSALCKSLDSQAELNGLSLNSWKSKKISDNGIAALCKSLRIKKNLTNLTLNFSEGEKLTDSSLEFLSIALQEFTDLDKLNINIDSSSQITDKGIEILTGAIGTLEKITQLTLHFSCCSLITDLSLVSISEAIKAIQSLSLVSLAYWQTPKITDAGLDILARSLEKHTKIEELDIFFGHTSTITDSGMVAFASVFEKLLKIKVLTLEFFKCTEITNKGIIAIGKQLENLTLLKHLTLDLFGTDSITNSALEPLRDFIIKAPKLKSISLDLSICMGISDKGIGYLNQAFSQASQLTEISLDLCKCVKVSEVQILTLTDALKQLQNLKVLKLNLVGLKINDVVKKVLGFNLQHIPNLKIISH